MDEDQVKEIFRKATKIISEADSNTVRFKTEATYLKIVELLTKDTGSRF